jgi:hypothetical protein
MAPTNRSKYKLKGGTAAATKPDNPAAVNPAAANNTAVATGGASKHSCFKHGTLANATKNNITEPDLPAAVAVHPAITNGADVLPRGDMATSIGGSDSIEYGTSTLLSSPSLLWPGATEAPSLSLNLLDRKINTSNTTVNNEITRIINHAANTTGEVETTMDTTINPSGATTNPLPPDSDTLQKLNITSTTKIYPSNTKTQTINTNKHLT